jgi:hypothetical protein
MPTGLFDIHDKAPIFTPDEIAAGEADCRARDIDYLELVPGQPVVRLYDFVEALKQRWQRAAVTARMIDAMRAGYCTVMPKTHAPLSDARH